MVALAVAHFVANSLVPEAARVPVKVAMLGAFLLWARGPAGLSWDELGMAKDKVGAGLRLGGLVALVITLGIAVLVAIPATREFFESGDVANDSATQRVLMTFLVIPIGTVVFEETLFRGILLGVLRRATTDPVAVVLSSVLFGLWHFQAALHDASGESAAATVGIVVGTIAITTAAGVLFAYLRLRSGSVVAPMLAHVATNSVAYVGAVIAA